MSEQLTSEIENSEAERLKQEAMRRRRARFRATMRLAFVAALTLLLAAFAFGALFKKVDIYQPAYKTKTIALRNSTDMVELLRSPKFSLPFSNLVASTEQWIAAADLKESEALAKQRQFIATRDTQISALYSLSTKEFIKEYSEVAPVKFAEFTDMLDRFELFGGTIAVAPSSPYSRNENPTIYMPAKDIARITGLSSSDALRLKYNLPSRAEAEAKQRQTERIKELEQLRPKVEQLEYELRSIPGKLFSKACDLKLELLRTNQLAEVQDLRTATQRDIHEFEQMFLVECTNRSWVLPIPFTKAVFAARRSQILIIISQNSQVNSDVVHCKTQQHQESLFGFLKRQFVADK